MSGSAVMRRMIQSTHPMRYVYSVKEDIQGPLRRQTNGWSSGTTTEISTIHTKSHSVRSWSGPLFMGIFPPLIPCIVDRMSPDFVIGLLVLIFATVPPSRHVGAWTLPLCKSSPGRESLPPQIPPARSPFFLQLPSSSILASSPDSPDVVTQTAASDSVRQAPITQKASVPKRPVITGHFSVPFCLTSSDFHPRIHHVR